MDIPEIQKQTQEFLEGMICNNLKIPNCEELRSKMNEELSSHIKGCTACKKAAIKNKYKKIIFDSLKNLPND
tara:strand:+ start:422 stop:637 length:216 start_codon:yes stop_codon:yes gene_type:complete